MCGKKKSLIGGYVEYPKVELSYGWDYPEGVPRDDDTFVRQYGKHVAKAVARFNKVHRNLPDLLQEVWSKLLGAKLLDKFVESAARRLPASMTAGEACRFLGVSFRQFTKALRCRPWLLLPLQGKRTSKFAIFDTREIIDIDGGLADDIWRRGLVAQMRPKITARGFKSYLTQAIYNHFANWCRTRSRKCREQLLAPTSALTRQTDGCCRQVATIEDLSGGWESNIAAAMTLDEESLLDLVGVIRQAKIDLDTSEGVAVLDFLVQQGKSCDDGPKRNVEILGLLGQGMTLREAAKRVQHRARARIKATTTA